MGFRQADVEGRGGYARMWTLEDKGNYSIAKISTSKRRKEGTGYDTDFQDGFVRLVGHAHEKSKSLNVGDKGVPIQIKSCDVTVNYNSETKKAYTNYVIFEFDVADSSTSTNTGSNKIAGVTSKAKSKPATEDMPMEDDLPF